MAYRKLGILITMSRSSSHDHRVTHPCQQSWPNPRVPCTTRKEQGDSALTIHCPRHVENSLKLRDDRTVKWMTGCEHGLNVYLNTWWQWELGGARRCLPVTASHRPRVVCCRTWAALIWGRWVSRYNDVGEGKSPSLALNATCCHP